MENAKSRYQYTKKQKLPLCIYDITSKIFHIFLQKNLKSAKVIKLAFDFSEGNTKNTILKGDGDKYESPIKPNKTK